MKTDFYYLDQEIPLRPCAIPKEWRVVEDDKARILDCQSGHGYSVPKGTQYKAFSSQNAGWIVLKEPLKECGRKIFRY